MAASACAVRFYALIWLTPASLSRYYLIDSTRSQLRIANGVSHLIYALCAPWPPPQSPGPRFEGTGADIPHGDVPRLMFDHKRSARDSHIVSLLRSVILLFFESTIYHSRGRRGDSFWHTTEEATALHALSLIPRIGILKQASVTKLASTICLGYVE